MGNNTHQSYISGDMEIFRPIYAWSMGKRGETIRCYPMMDGMCSQDESSDDSFDPVSSFHPSLYYGPLRTTESVLPGLVPANLPSRSRWLHVTQSIDSLNVNPTLFRLFRMHYKTTTHKNERTLILICVYHFGFLPVFVSWSFKWYLSIIWLHFFS